MLGLPKISIQMHYLKASKCNKKEEAKTFPVVQQEESSPSAACDTGLLSSITGETAGSELPPFRDALAFCVVFLSHCDVLPAIRLAQGPQEGGSHRKINGRSLLLALSTEKKKSV